MPEIPGFPEHNPAQEEATAAAEARLQLYQLQQLVQKGALPADPAAVERLSDIQAIAANFEPETETRAAAARAVTEQCTAKKYNPFDTAPHARQVVGNLLGEQQIDMASLILVARETEVLLFEALGGAQPSKEFIDERITPLRIAVIQELALRLDDEPGRKLPDLETGQLYKRLYGKIDTPEEQALMVRYIEEMLGPWIQDIRHALRFTGVIANEKSEVGGTYYRPLSPANKHELQEVAADTLEMLQMHKNYGVTPMVIPAETIGLDWDIAVFPPLNRAMEGYDEHALADFLFLTPNPDRTDALLEHQEVDIDENALRLSNGEHVQTRFRLYDDGQISQSQRYINLPGDYVERVAEQGFNTAAVDFITRLQALFVAIACDALVPDVVIRERVGGRVSESFGDVVRKVRRSEPLMELLLRRRQELTRAQQSNPKNPRQPSDWPAPERSRIGYRRRLAEGTKRRPAANEEAIEYFASIGVAYPGLKDDENFVRPKIVEDEPLTVRKARFRTKARSKTSELLGSLTAQEEAAGLADPGDEN